MLDKALRPANAHPFGLFPSRVGTIQNRASVSHFFILYVETTAKVLLLFLASVSGFYAELLVGVGLLGKQKRQRMNRHCVLLTGAIGYVGDQLLKALESRDDI